jgi:type VI secretion system secreted protein Hcp
MRIKHLIATTLAASVLFVSSAAMAAVDAFLKIDGIQGESKDSKHAKEIAIESFSWGANQGGSQLAAGGGGGSGKVVMHDFRFTHRLDAASPKLFVACATGEHIKEVVLTLRKAGDKPLEFLKVKLTDVIISSVAPSGAQGGELPMEEVKIKYAKIEIEYVGQDNKGNPTSPIKVGYDVKLNKKV